MKKMISVILSLISVICIVFALTGCDGKATEENKKLAEENAQLIEENKKLQEEYNKQLAENEKLSEENNQLVENKNKLSEENKQLIENNNKLMEELSKPAIDKIINIESGSFCTLQVGYDNGLLTQNDLKSIACHYYEVRKYEENPYSGMFDPHEELSQDTENEIKQAYLNQIAKYPEGLLDNVTLSHYFGTYNGNIVVGIYSIYVGIDPYEDPLAQYVGGVFLKGFLGIEISIYHI